MKAKFLILWGQNSNPNPVKMNILGLDIKAVFFVELMVE
jgi:hypothetical protein